MKNKRYEVQQYERNLMKWHPVFLTDSLKVALNRMDSAVTKGIHARILRRNPRSVLEVGNISNI